MHLYGGMFAHDQNWGLDEKYNKENNPKNPWAANQVQGQYSNIDCEEIYSQTEKITDTLRKRTSNVLLERCV